MNRFALPAVAAALLFAGLSAPAMADESTEAFQLNVQRATKTLNDMQALFARMDQRKRDQAAGTAPQTGATQAAPGGAAQASAE